MWTQFQEFPYIKTFRTQELVEVLFLKRCAFDIPF